MVRDTDCMPRDQQIVHQHISMGWVIKVHALYAKPFWREEGLSGTGFGGGLGDRLIGGSAGVGDGPRGVVVGALRGIDVGPRGDYLVGFGCLVSLRTIRSGQKCHFLVLVCVFGDEENAADPANATFAT